MVPSTESAAIVEYMDLKSSAPGLINLLTLALWCSVLRERDAELHKINAYVLFSISQAETTSMFWSLQSRQNKNPLKMQ
jgi:hypothetical protein